MGFNDKGAMTTNNCFLLTCYYVRDEVAVPVFETRSFQQLEIKVRRKAAALLCYPYDPKLEIQRDYLSIQITRKEGGTSFSTEVCKYSRSTTGNYLWAY